MSQEPRLVPVLVLLAINYRRKNGVKTGKLNDSNDTNDDDDNNDDDDYNNDNDDDGVDVDVDDDNVDGGNFFLSPPPSGFFGRNKKLL